MTLSEIHVSLQDLASPIATLVLIFFSYQLRVINNRFKDLEGQFTDILNKIDEKLETLVREDLCSERRVSLANEIQYNVLKGVKRRSTDSTT